MEKFRFGKTELMVSKVAFGGIPIMRLSKGEASRLVKEIVGLGINFIDSANVYLDSEEKIGDAIKTIKREDLVIATKTFAKDKKTFNEHLDLSLKRLGVNYIDIYQFHNLHTEAQWNEIFAPGGSMEGMTEAIKAGKVRFPGFSSHSIPKGIEFMKRGVFASVQLPFNYIDFEAAKEAVPLAKKLDIGFIAMKPMGGGLLYNASLSFRYLFSFDNVFPDPGIEKIDEMSEIVKIFKTDKSLRDEDKAEIEKQRIELGTSWCHRCDYCQPCPQGIQISAALCAESAFKRMTPERAQAMSGVAIEKAKTCTECGSCMTRCPYNLKIPALLKEKIKLWEKLQHV